MKRCWKVAAVVTPLFVAALLIVAAVTALIFLHFSRKAEAATAAEIRALFDAKVQAQDEALLAARKAVPPDAPIPPDWDCAAGAAKWDAPGYALLFELIEGFIESPDKLPEDANQRLLNRVVYTGTTGNMTAFETKFDPTQYGFDGIIANLSDYLATSSDLAEFEAGIELGLCRWPGPNLTEAYTDYFFDLSKVMRLIAARAICEAQVGQYEKALQTCFRGYDLTDLCFEEPVVPWLSCDYYFLYHKIDRALWYIVDTRPLSEALEAEVLKRLEESSNADTWVDTIRLGALRAHEGHMPMIFAPFKIPFAAVLGRGPFRCFVDGNVCW